jgi:hypothetical protein
MAENLFIMGNYATPSTTNPTPSTTTAAVNIQLQLATPATKQLSLVEYGISFSGSPSAIPITLRVTGTSSSALTTAGTILPYNNMSSTGAAVVASVLTSSTTACAFMNSGTAVAPAATVSTVLDAQLLTTNTYVKQFPLAREPEVPVSSFLQLVVTAGTAATAYCYFIWRE